MLLHVSSHARQLLQGGLQSGHFLPVGVAWVAIIVLSHLNAIPIDVSTLRRHDAFQKSRPFSSWLQNRFLNAALIFVFHITSTSEFASTWALSLVALAIYWIPSSHGSLDIKFANPFGPKFTWRSLFEYDDAQLSLRTLTWTGACVTSFLCGLIATLSLVDFAVALILVVVGWSTYVCFPEMMLAYDCESIRAIHRQLFLPVAIQSAVSALVIWVVFGSYTFPPSSLSISAILSAVKGLAILSSLIDGTALPVLALLSITAIVQGALIHTTWSLLAIILLLTSATIQLFTSLPKSADKKRSLWMFIALPLMLTAVLEGYFLSQKSMNFSESSSNPIQILHETNLALFEQKAARQSQTVSDAIAEYKDRYGREPPKHFDKWFEIAKSNSFQFVDEFDTIMSSIVPFWAMDRSQLQDRLKSVFNTTGIYTFEMRNSRVAYGPEQHYHGDKLSDWIHKWADHDLFPDFTFAINTLDEPRVSTPHQATKPALDHVHDVELPTDRDAKVDWLNVGQKNLKIHLMVACSSDASQSIISPNSLPFINDLATSKDFCQSPTLFEQHGFFQAPETLYITRSAVPILSQCKPGHFNDILYPSPYYSYLDASDHLTDADDADWEYKSDSLYWSGSSTGGHSTVDNWRKLHRQHLSLVTTTDSDTPLRLLRPQVSSSSSSNTTWEVYNSTWSSVSSYFSIRLNRIVQCDDEACEAMKSSFPLVGHKDPVTSSIASKYALDMDGNTFSGRFYRLLRSKSCVLKMTAFKEWHDDFLQPWVHYIPVSAGFEELGEMVRYFFRDRQGQQIGKKVAEQGREWSRKVLREVDMEIVNLRVLMEVGRLLS